MNSLYKLVAGVAATAALAGCMHRGVENVSAGDIAIDSLSATRTAILRVNNASSSTVRFYMDMPGMKPLYVAKAMPGQVRSWVLDPSMFPATSVSFKAQPEGGTEVTLGPYRVNRNETIEVTVPAMTGQASATVHRSTP